MNTEKIKNLLKNPEIWEKDEEENYYYYCEGKICIIVQPDFDFKKQQITLDIDVYDDEEGVLLKRYQFNCPIDL